MSRIGKQPIVIPNGVEITATDGLVRVKGKKGTLEMQLPKDVRIDVAGSQAVVAVSYVSKDTAALWGLVRAKVSNMAKGVSDGFVKKLEFEGVGFKAQVGGKTLTLSLGYTNPIEFPIPEDITITVEKNVIVVAGADKELVGEIAAKIRSQRVPEPYKGSGIRYQGEYIARKAGKKAATGTTA